MLLPVPALCAFNVYDYSPVSTVEMYDDRLPSEITYENRYPKAFRAAGGNGNDIDTGDETSNNDQNGTRNDTDIGEGLHLLFIFSVLYLLFRKRIKKIEANKSSANL